MYKPQFHDPQTGKLKNIYSADFMKLLESGYTEEELLALRFIPYANLPLTYNQDIDYEISKYLNVNDFRNYSKVNQYSYEISQNNTLWIALIEKLLDNKKYIFDDLQLHELKLDNPNYKHVYNILEKITDYLEEITSYFNINLHVKNNVDIINKLKTVFFKIFDKDMTDYLKHLMIMFVSEKYGGTYEITFYDNDYHSKNYKITKKQALLLLFYIYYYAI